MTLLLFWSAPDAINGYRQAGGASATGGLSAVLYNVAGDAIVENLDGLAQVGVRWDLNGHGPQRFEFLHKGRPRIEDYRRYQDHIGGRVALFDGAFHKPLVDGWVYEISLAKAGVHYVCGTAAKRLDDQYETNNPTSGAQDSIAYLASVLANHAPHIYEVPGAGTDLAKYPNLLADASQVSGTGMGTWVVDANLGTKVSDIVNDVLLMGTSTAGEILDLWVEPNRLTRGLYPQDAVVYLKARSNSGLPEWRVSLQDITSVEMSREIWDWVSDVSVWDGSALQAATLTEDTTYGTVMRRESQDNFNATQAAQYADVLVTAYNTPSPRLSFTIGSGWVRDAVNGLRRPWDMLRSPGYLVIDDLYPTGNLIDVARDGKLAFRIVSLDYDHGARTMRVVPDTFRGDRRIDVILQQLGAEVGQFVQPGPGDRWWHPSEEHPQGGWWVYV